MTSTVRFWLAALLAVIVLLVPTSALARAGAAVRVDVNKLAGCVQPSGPPRPGAARRRVGPWRAELASAPGRTAPHPGGAAPRHMHLDESLHSSPSGDVGGYSYSAFGKVLKASDPGGLPDPTVQSPFLYRLVGLSR